MKSSKKLGLDWKNFNWSEPSIILKNGHPIYINSTVHPCYWDANIDSINHSGNTGIREKNNINTVV